MSEASLAPIAPSPLHTIRSHNSAISVLFVSGDNERIYSGDVSGLVVITSTRSIRPLASWKAHTDGLLGVEEWGEQQVITSVCGSSRLPGEMVPLTWSFFRTMPSPTKKPRPRQQVARVEAALACTIHSRRRICIVPWHVRARTQLLARRQRPQLLPFLSSASPQRRRR